MTSVYPVCKTIHFHMSLDKKLKIQKTTQPADHTESAGTKKVL